MKSNMLESNVRELIQYFERISTDPLYSVSQISLLLLIRHLDKINYKGCFDEMGSYRWNHFITEVPTQEWREFIQKQVVPEITKRLPNKDTLRPLIEDSKQLYLLNASQTSEIINLIEEMYKTIEYEANGNRNRFDLLQRIMFEQFLKILETSPSSHERTPTYLARAALKMLPQRKYNRICDPCCGTGTFLQEAYRMFGSTLHQYGYDHSLAKARITLLNLMFQGKSDAHIYHLDSLTKEFNASQSIGSFDLVVAHTPHTDEVIDPQALNADLKRLKVAQSELLFAQHCLNIVSPDGFLILLVSEHLLASTDKGFKQFRDRLLRTMDINIVVKLPSGTCQANTKSPTYLIIARKYKTDISTRPDQYTTKILYYQLKNLQSKSLSDMVKIMKADIQYGKMWNFLLEEERRVFPRTPLIYPAEWSYMDFWFVNYGQIFNDKGRNMSLDAYRPRFVPYEDSGHQLNVSEQILQKMQEGHLYTHSELIGKSRRSFLTWNLALQQLISSRDIQAIIQKDGHVKYRRLEKTLKSAEKRNFVDSTIRHWLDECLSPAQCALFKEYAFSDRPLPIHEATSNLKGEYPEFGVQEAKSATELFEHLGLLERVTVPLSIVSPRLSKQGEEKDSVIDLWQVTEGVI